MSDALMFVIILFAIIGIAIIIAIVDFEITKKRTICSKCGEKFDIDNDIDIEHIGNETKLDYAHYNKNNFKNEVGTSYGIVEFTCNCQNCGNVQIFKKKFKTGSLTLNNDGSSVDSSFSLQRSIDKYLRYMKRAQQKVKDKKIQIKTIQNNSKNQYIKENLYKEKENNSYKDSKITSNLMTGDYDEFRKKIELNKKKFEEMKANLDRNKTRK